MSASEGFVPQVNKFEQVSGLDYRMPVAEGGIGGSLRGVRSNALWVMVT